MNKPIARLAFVATSLMVVLVIATTYWQAWAAGGLADRQENQIERVAQFTIERGRIVTREPAAVLARNRPKRVAGRTLFFRKYPAGGWRHTSSATPRRDARGQAWSAPATTT